MVSAWAREGAIDLVEVPDWEGWVAGWPRLPVPVVARLNGSVAYFAAEAAEPLEGPALPSAFAGAQHAGPRGGGLSTRAVPGGVVDDHDVADPVDPRQCRHGRRDRGSLVARRHERDDPRLGRAHGPWSAGITSVASGPTP